MNHKELLQTIRDLGKLSFHFAPEETPPKVVNESNLVGFSGASLSLAIHKETTPNDFASEQGMFMMYLSLAVCPRVLAFTDTGYCMEYLRPIEPAANSIRRVEKMLTDNVWNRSTIIHNHGAWTKELLSSINLKVPDWAMENLCLIHGDPTLDNAFETQLGYLRIGDPIPPSRLMRPSIQSVDCGKMLQSLIGWETALRSWPLVEYDWPDFMLDEQKARRAIFWCIVALKRLYIRNKESQPGQWANAAARELEQCV